MKLQLFVIDKNRIFKKKAKYDEENRIAVVRIGIGKQRQRFQIDPNHIYFLGRKCVCFIDNSTKSSIALHSEHSDKDIDVQKTIFLNYLVEKSFWQALIERRKISTLTIITLLLAGVGLYHFLLTILRVVGINV